MANNNNKTTLTISKPMMGLVIFLIGSGFVSGAGFGFYTFQNLPHVITDLVELEERIVTLEHDLSVANGQTIRSHIGRRAYDRAMKAMKEERDELEKEMKELLRALARQP